MFCKEKSTRGNNKCLQNMQNREPGKWEISRNKLPE